MKIKPLQLNKYQKKEEKFKFESGIIITINLSDVLIDNQYFNYDVFLDHSWNWLAPAFLEESMLDYFGQEHFIVECISDDIAFWKIPYKGIIFYGLRKVSIPYNGYKFKDKELLIIKEFIFEILSILYFYMQKCLNNENTNDKRAKNEFICRNFSNFKKTNTIQLVKNRQKIDIF